MNALVPAGQPQLPAPTFTMSDMERIALAIAKGGLFGSTDPNAVLTLCMVAQAEGKHPGLVMQQYDLIQGKPAKKAQAMQVDFLASGGSIEWHQYDDEAADATFSHPLGGSVRIRWDMERAKQAGLGGKDMWKKYPRQMLRSRTISEGVRTVFPGATSGMYVPEEVADFDSRPAPRTPPAQRARDMKPERTEPEQPLLEAQTVDPNRQKAEEWLAGFVKDPADTPANARALSKLQREHPDLYERAIAAIAPAGDPETDTQQDDASSEPFEQPA